MQTNTQKPPSAFAYLRDIIAFPVMVTFILPYFVFYNKNQTFIPANTVFKAAGVVFFIAGIGLFIATNYLFITVAKATLAPWSPKQNLVVLGPYRYCRNPMITGVLCILLAEALYFHSTNILIWAGVFFCMNTIFFMKVEEPYLTKTFGAQYLDYKKHVSRWVPKMTPYKSGK